MAKPEIKQEEKKKYDDNFRYIVRIASADVDGKKPVQFAMRKIKGVSHMISNAVCQISGVDGMKKAGYLTDAEIEKLNDVLKSPLNYGVPSWMANRRKDTETGKDSHLLGADLIFTSATDIKMMRKIKCYKGIRHSKGLPVRGQKTRSNFRRNKGKALGVKKKKE